MIGFKVGNGLFPDKTARCYQEDSGHLPERTDEEKRVLKKVAMYSMMLDKEKPPRALIGESGESN